MEHPHAGQEPELDGLLGEGVGARDDGLRGDDGRHRGERHHGIVGPSGGEQIERIGDRAGVGQEQRSLPEIVQDKAGQDDGEPAEADRQPAEMAHIGIHRLAAGDGQEGGAEHGETDAGSRMDEVAQRAERADARPGWRVRERSRARPSTPMTANHSSIAGPKMLPMKPVPLRWTRNSPIRISDADGHDHRRELRRVDFQSFHGAQYRDRRRDDAVAIEQRGPDQPDDEKGGAPASRRRMPGIEKREKRHDAALAVIVGAHDENGVFQRDDQDQRPEDQRHDARDGLGRQRPAGIGRLLERIKRARADIAVDDAQRGKGRRERNARSAMIGLNPPLEGLRSSVPPPAMAARPHAHRLRVDP